MIAFAVGGKADLAGSLLSALCYSRGNQPVVVFHRKPSKEFMCKLRKRIIARAHDYDAVASTGQPDQHVTTAATVRKSKGLSTAPFNFANNIVAADAAVDSAAEINRLRHDKNILVAQPACKALHQSISHETNRAVPMGLKHQQQAAGERVKRFERG